MWRCIDLLLLAASLGLAYYGQYLFNARNRDLAILVMGLAMILFAWALRRVQSPEPATAPTTPMPPALWRRLVGGALIVLSLGCCAAMLWLFSAAEPTNLGWALYLASMALFAGATVVMEWRPDRAWRRSQLIWIRDHRWELFVLFVLVALGGFVRLYGLDVFPAGVWYDESDNAVWSRDILTNPTYRPQFAGTLPAHFLYLVALAFKWFGVSAGSLRLVTGLFGTGLIVAMWMLGREYGGKWVGLLAAALVTVSHWCINFSRVGMHGIATPFFAALAVYWLLRGLRTGSRVTLASGGLMLGIGLCFYSPFRLFPFAIIVFFLAKLICEKGFLGRAWLHIGIYVLASFIAFAPIGHYALTHQQEFFGRTKQASVFADKTPEQGLAALKSNIIKHVLMFNYEGDHNGRHNLPGEPMLDPIAGAWLPLGVAFALARLHRPRQILLHVSLWTMLSAGIFSLDFEAPQALRSIGAIPAIFLFIAQAIPPALRELVAPLRQLPWKWPRPAAIGLLSVCVVAGWSYSAWLNYDIYFIQQPRHPIVFHGYNARESLTGRMIVAESDRYIFYSMYVGHPTIRFLAPDAPDHRTFRSIDDLPVRGLVQKDVMYVMEPEFAPPADLFSFWYPDGTITWIHDPTGAPMLLLFDVPREAVNASQGVAMRLYSAEDHTQSNPLSETRVDRLGGRWDELNTAGAGRGEWIGQVFAPYSGAYVLHLQSAGTAALILDGNAISLPAGGTVDEPRILTKGWHSLRLVADAVAGGEVQVQWTTPDGRRDYLARESLNTNPGLDRGLYGYYYPNYDWSGVPAFGRIDWQIDFRWHIQPLPTPFSVEWLGGLKIDQAGPYSLALNSNAGASLDLNGTRLLGDTDASHGYQTVELYLEPGVYPVRVRYHEAGGYSMMRLYWKTPAGEFGAIPAANLTPAVAQGDALLPFEMLPPALAAPEAPPPAPPIDDVPQVEARLVSTLAADARLEIPRAIAVGNDGRVYVSDAGKKQVVVLDAQGKLADVWGKGTLVEPGDLAVATDNTLYVLDAGASHVVHFAPDGEIIGTLGEKAGLYSPRGLALTADGNLVIADTGSNRMMILSPDGVVLRVMGFQGPGPGQFNQPVDVAVAPDGHILVADTLINKRVQVFDRDGEFQYQWLTPWASDFIVPVMGITGDGRVLMADADRGRVWEYALDGSQPVWWSADALARPLGLSLDPDGHVLVLDEQSRLVYRFAR
jgi:4-amino-4-deoxy-L-arabinose transferase-like glycosyltransferase